MRRSVTGLVGFAAAAFGVAVVAAQETRPKGVPFYTWVREDTFAGWMNNDTARHAKGIKRAEEYVDENPANGEAVNWVGAGKIFDATRAFEAGDRARGDLLFAEGVALMEKGVKRIRDAGHEIALAKESAQFATFENEDGSHVQRRHGFDNLGDSLSRFDRVRRPVSQNLIECLHSRIPYVPLLAFHEEMRF
jgi:hypothetical protein